MIRIDDHTFDEKLVINGNGWIIDAGCRGFNLARKWTEYVIGQQVYALDIENFSDQEVFGDVIFRNAALCAKSGDTEAYFFGNGTANFLKGINDVPENSAERPCETRKVKCITLEYIYAEIGTNIDLLKLDIEGAEYEVMMGMRHVPKQISVEFHEHTNKTLHDKYIDRILDKFCKDYALTLNIREWPQYKYMDCLFIRKDLL